MPFKPVLLWTDVALWALFAALAWYAWRVVRQPQLRANWLLAARDGATMGAGAVLALFMLISALDSVHFRRALPPALIYVEEKGLVLPVVNLGNH